ncbi:hypothetical protein BpHYR1_041755 [Brachionus plicatilis]|uniref:Uncharacterized protein n=1 Tax=Brachionus plicatilis TaxID=10195 RepID=A0A3M7RW48_BRAPC|nr:hypothetical protein BpHYR1_041755 [Brachionus plicatilis]
MAKPGTKQTSQFAVKNAPATEPRTKSLPDNLRKKTNAWQTTNVHKSDTGCGKVTPLEKSTTPNEPNELDETKSDKEMVKPKEESKETAQPSREKNVCTVKPTKQVVAADPKPTAVPVGNSASPGSVPSPHSNTQHLADSQSINKYYDKIVINQTSSSTAAAVVAVTVTSIQHQQPMPSSSEQIEQRTALKQSSSSSSIKNQSSPNVSSQSDGQPTQAHNNSSEMCQMGAAQMPNYNFAPAATASQTSLMSSPSQTNSQLSASSLMHSLSINQSMQPAQFMQPIYQPMVQPFVPQSRPMVGQNQPTASQPAKPSLNSLFDLNFGEFNGKEGMFYAPAPPPPPPPQNYIGQMAPGQPQPVPLNPYPNGFEHSHQFFGQKLLNNKPNGAFVQPGQFNGINGSLKSQFAPNAPSQLINQMHQYNKQEYAFFNGQMPPAQNFAPAPPQPNSQAGANTNNLGFFMSQIGNLNASQFQAQQSVFNMGQGQLSNNQLFGLGYNQHQHQQQQQQQQQHQPNSQFNLSNLMQTPQNQPGQQTPAPHRQTPLSMPSSPFVQSDSQHDNAFMKQPNGFDINYKSQQAGQTSYASRNGASLAANKQMFAALEAANNFDKGPQANKTQSNSYYRSMDQSVQSHYGQVGMIPPQQQPPLLPNPPMMHNQLPSQMQQQQQQQQQQNMNMNNKMGFSKPAAMARYPNAYASQSRPQAPAAYYNQNYSRRAYTSQASYQSNGKKMPFMDGKVVVQKNCDQVKQDGTQAGQAVQSQTRGSTPNASEEKNECTSANVI